MGAQTPTAIIAKGAVAETLFSFERKIRWVQGKYLCNCHKFLWSAFVQVELLPFCA